MSGAWSWGMFCACLNIFLKKNHPQVLTLTLSGLLMSFFNLNWTGKWVRGSHTMDWEAHFKHGKGRSS